MDQVMQDQVLAAIRWLLTVVGGAAVAHGYISSDQLPLIGGLLVAAVPLVWSVYAHSRFATVKAAAKLSSVAVVVTDAEKADHKDNPAVLVPVAAQDRGTLLSAMAS